MRITDMQITRDMQIVCRDTKITRAHKVHNINQ